MANTTSPASLERWYDWMQLIQDAKRGVESLSIPILDDSGTEIGRLDHLGGRHVGDAALVDTFVRWRNQNRSGWLDQRVVTTEGTAKWVFDVATNPTRIAHLMYFGEKLIGRCGSVDLKVDELMSDGLVRGERGGGIDFIRHAQVASLLWTFESGGPDVINSKVLSSNELALENLRRLGCTFPAFKSSSLYRTETQEGLNFLETGLDSQLVPDIRLLYVRLTRQGFSKSVLPQYNTLHQAVADRLRRYRSSFSRSGVDPA